MYVAEKIYFFWIIIYFHISAFIRTGNDSLLFVSYFGKETKKSLCSCDVSELH